MTRPAPDFIDAYQSLLRDGWETWLRQVDPAATPGLDEKAAVARMIEGIGQYTQWLATNAASVAPGTATWTPPPAFAGLSGDDAQQKFQAWLKATQDWLGTPSAAPHSGAHATHHALAEAFADLTAQQQRYQALLARVQADGLAALGQKISRAPAGDIPTMRSLYDAWVEVAEEAYNNAALSEDFREAYGALTNAQVRVRTLQQDQFSRVAEHMGMPSRGDIDALARSIQDMRREIALLRSQTGTVQPAATGKPVKKRAPVKKGAAVKKAAKTTKR